MKGLSNLRHLELAGTAVTDAGLEHLKDFENLTYLALYGTRVTEKGAKALEKARPDMRIGSAFTKDPKGRHIMDELKRGLRTGRVTKEMLAKLQQEHPDIAAELARSEKKARIDDKQRAKEFFAALAKADTAAMEKFYAPKILLKAGSTLLLKGRKDLLVDRKTVIRGYETMIKEFGKDEWVKLFPKIGAEKINITVAQEPDRPFSGVRKGDTIMKVATGQGDKVPFLLFILRRDSQGKLQVVAEATGY